MDTTQGTASNRLKLYVNGVQETDFSVEAYPAEDYEDNYSESSRVHQIGARYAVTGNSTQRFSGYIAEVHFVDGAQKAATDFGEFDEDSGIWIPKAYSGSHGTNGFHLNFDSSGSMGADSSGNSNTFTLVNIAAVNQTTDTPTNNFCTLNPNDRTVNPTYDGQIVDGMFEYQPESGTSMVRGTMGMSSGKWYWECKLQTTQGQQFGVCTDNMDIPVTSTQEGGSMINTVGGDALTFSVYAASHYRSYFVYDGTNWNSAAAWQDQVNISAGSIMGFAVDMDNLDVYMSKEGSWTDVITNQDPEGDPGSNTPFVYHASFNRDEDDTWMPVFSNTYNQDMELNFGNPIHSISSGNADANGYGNFEYAVPDGYYALCTKNIAEFG
jgi:hypothetical protein